MKRLFVFLILFITVCLIVSSVRADQLDDVTRELEALKRDLSGKEANYQQLNKQLNDIKAELILVSAEIQKKEVEVKKGDEALIYQKNLLNARARSYYKNIKKNSVTLVNVFIAENLSESLRNFFYQKSLVDEDKRTIIKIVLYIKNLEELKANLEKEKNKLASIQIEVDAQATILNGEIAKTKSRVAELNALQQSLIAQKLASLNISRSAYSMGRCDSDLTNGRDPGFSPKFAFFTYGVPHRNGMNQYGAWGRAKTGQNEEQILQEYYPNMTLKKDYDQNAQITTTTGWSGTIEDYVKRIYEVPDSWTDNNLAVLKAQAVAARSYALNSMKRNGSICTSESCQVFKPEPKGGNWEQAAEATKGWVLMDGGDPGFTQYASTHGGYILNLGKFDGRDGNPGSFGELNDRAYDKDSPWFYCDWGSRGEYNKTAWLKPNELADIANVIMLARNSDVDKNHLFQPDKSNPAGTDTWDAEKVKSELRNRGTTPINSVNDVSVSADFGSGRSTNVNVSGDSTSYSFSASEFKDWFNLRAPANIQIVGPLYNVEKR